MEIKLLVLDIDGTTINSNHEITPRTRQAIMEAQRRGVTVALASGRPTEGMKFIAQELEIAQNGGYILSYNGGKITEASSGKVVFQQALPAHILPILYQAAMDAGAQISTYDQEFVISEDTQNPYVQHEITLTRMKGKQVENFVETASELSPKKCLIVGEPQQIIPIGEQLNRLYSTEINTFRSEDFYLEVVPVGVDKALSLQKLLVHLGLTPQQMMAMGDGHNDLTMIGLAGLGVAMGNAKPEVKNVANHITLCNDQDGAAVAIEKFVLQNPTT